MRTLIFDCVTILLISLVAEAVVFSGQQGRAVLCEDSIQYIASADGILGSDNPAGFGIRKAGYPLFLAGIKTLTGQLGWTAVLANHLLLALVPLVAYGFGFHLRSRWVGWAAAILVLVQLQTIPWGNRILSEPLYTVIAGFGLLAFVAAFQDEKKRLLLMASGILLGLAWLTRGVAVPILGIAIFALIASSWRNWRSLPAKLALFMTPLAAVYITECSLNHAATGQFQASNGGSGIALWGCRMRYYEGQTEADSPEIREVLSWVPQRDTQDAYRANISDCWIGRYYAIRQHGLDDWGVNSRMQKAGVQAILHDPVTYAGNVTDSVYLHLFRKGGGNARSDVPVELRFEHIEHPLAAGSGIPENQRYLLWSDPFASDQDNLQRTRNAVFAATTKAPFGNNKILATLRYWKTFAPVAATIDTLERIGHIWAGFGLLLCFWMGWKRSTCIILGLIILSDASFVSMLTITSDRFQFVWLPVDMAFLSVIPACLIAFAVEKTTKRNNDALKMTAKLSS